MRRLARTVIAAAVIAAPFVAGAAVAPAEATCRPEKPSTCQTYCPPSWTRVGTLCLPIPESAITP